MRRILAALAAVASLAGCPLPQPLPDYPAGTITPPRILTASISFSDPVIRVPAGCTGPEPTYALATRIYYSNTVEQVGARWFVNYPDRPDPILDLSVPADPDPVVFERVVPGFEFRPYQYAPPQGTGTLTMKPFDEEGTARVVELVVSNNFFAPPEAAPEPWRSPAANFEAQLHRWVFLLVPEPAACAVTPGAAGCCPVP